MIYQKLVEEFCEKFGVTMSTQGDQVVWLRHMFEEFDELCTAVKKEDPVEVLDAVTDLIYYLLQAYNFYRVDFNDCFLEVHEANMRKSHRENGKVQKPEGWQPPNIRRILDERDGR